MHKMYVCVCVIHTMGKNATDAHDALGTEIARYARDADDAHNAPFASNHARDAHGAQRMR